MIEIRRMDGTSVHIEKAGTAGTLLDVLREQGIPIAAECSGRGNCGSCRVRFFKDAPEPTKKEKSLLSEQALRDGVRLACETRRMDGCAIQIEAVRGDDIQVLADGMRVKTSRVPDIPGFKTAGMEVLDGGGDYGAAVDIGTTTLAVVLVRLSDGVRCGTATAANSQRAYGADVIARIQAANEGKGTRLQERIRADICALLEALVTQAGIGKRRLKRLVIVGNTAMCHLLRGLSCKGLGVSPFVPADITLWEGTAEELLGTAEWEAGATVFPGISAFVGADIVSGIYAAGIDLREDAAMLLDIGTNGEMVLGSRNGFLVTSAAAGPVFEGGTISCGVPGIPGAVSHARLCHGGENGETGELSSPEMVEWHCETIGGEPPVGLCGTGIVDVMGELASHGLVDENGTLADAWFARGVPVAGDAVRFTQSDIRQIQMGKSAIRAGIETLLDEGGKQDNGRLPVYLAGGFGYDMNVEQAVRIGMFPPAFLNQVKPVGNSALEGAIQYLVSGEREDRERLLRIVRRAQELNLAMHPQFHERYLEYMFFPEDKGIGYFSRPGQSLR